MKIVTNSDQLGFLIGRHSVEIVPSEELLHTWYDGDSYGLVVVDIDQAEGVYSPRVIKETGSNLPIIGITEDLFYDGEWTEHKAVFIEQGGDYLLRAPVNPREMLSCVGALKRRFEAIRPSIYLCERTFVVNTFFRRATFNGIEPHMTGKENLLLMDLADHFGQVRSKEQLLSNLYTLDGDAAEIKIIDVFICKIRKKLNWMHPGLGGIIETVWGQGYRLRDTELENLREVG